MPKHVLINIDTLGAAADSVILSIGAVGFTDTTAEGIFYTVIDGESCQAYNMKIDWRAVCWWMEQSDTARTLFQEAEGGTDLADALQALTDAFDWNDTLVWDGGEHYRTLGILAYAYRAVGMEPPWTHYNTRCYKTWAETVGDVRFDFSDCLTSLETSEAQVQIMLEVNSPNQRVA